MAALALLIQLLGAEEPPPTRTIDIEDGGYRRTFEIADDEIYVRPIAGEGRILTIPKTPEGSVRFQLAHQALPLASAEAEVVLYERNLPRSESSRRILTKKVRVRLGPKAIPKDIAHRVGATAIQKIEYADGWFVFATDEPGGALNMTWALRKMSEVISADPLLGRRLTRKLVPNDPLFQSQWFLLNMGQTQGKPGTDLNVVRAWDTSRGRGVTIAIVDDGLQLTHPDLARNVASGLHHDYRDGDSDPIPSGSEDFHGTAVAGVAAARGDNSLGVTGVAFEATLVGVRLVGGIAQTDQQSANALMHSNQVVQVSNNSWGAEDNGRTLDGPGPLMQLARERAVQVGRNGQGTVFVWAAGNGGEVQDNVNYDGYVNSMYVIPVAAINDLGKQAAYSEPGACLVVTAPSNIGEASVQEGISTTDLSGEEGLNYSAVTDDFKDIDYTQYFGGTSAAAPMASGVIALMLEANPNLGWRDVKEILIRSATQVDPFDPDWMVNGAGLRFSHKFGAGLINAAMAVTQAANWASLGPQTNRVQEHSGLNTRIPDNDPPGITLAFDFRKLPALRVEHAVLTATIAHPHRGELVITLISPHGTRSRLAERHPDINANYESWKFLSVFHWGESSQGEWKLHIADLRTFDIGELRNARLELFGADAPQLSRPWLTPLGLSAGQVQLRLIGLPGSRYEIQASTDLTDWTVVATPTLDSTGAYDHTESSTAGARRFFRALRTSPPP